jgi:3-deoxy-D-manno-octulosonic-acid transferase
MRRIAEKILSFLAPYLGWLILWFVTLTSRLIVVGRDRIKPGSMLASWHSSFSLPVFILRKLHLTCIVSPSDDGLLLERFLLLSGCKVIRGSTRRGGLTALRKASEELEKGEILGITPDGPLGPPRVPHKGVLFLAREGHPVIPVGVSARPAIRLKTWDRHLLPLPFSRIVVSFGEPVLLKGVKEEIDIIGEAINKEEEKADKLLRREGNSLWEMFFPILLYNIAIFLLLPFVFLYLSLRELKGKHLRGWKERFGFVPKSQGGIWFHAVSVGEVMAVKPIIEIISSRAPERKIFLSTITNTGRETANKHLSSLATIFFFPFDLLPFPFIALRRLKPSLLCLVETEIWPNLIFLARLLNIPIVLVNGRISDRSLLSLKALRFFFAPFLRQINLLMQSERDERRAEMCGGTNVKVLGNTKFDQVSGLRNAERLEGLRRVLGISEYEDVLLAGSTHPGEEEKILRAYWDVRLSYPDLRLIIAPRHPERIPQVEALLAREGFSFVRRSSLPSLTLDPHAIILIDTVGELSTLYGLSTVSFVGGSLIPKGGHNILEPLVWGKPALFGPYMNNFRDIAELAKKEGVGIEIRGEKELGEKIKLLLSLPSWRREIEEKALALIERMRGAGDRYADFILELLEGHKKNSK